MTNVVVCGVGGRMGQRLAQLVLESGDLELVGATEHPGHEAVGRALGDVVGGDRREGDRAVTSDLNQVVGRADVVIVFTSPEATLTDAAVCSRSGTAMVVGTTGFSGDQLAEFQKAVAGISCVFAPNFSTAMNVLFKLVEEAARMAEAWRFGDCS